MPRALVIAAQTAGLAGANGDARAIAAWLTSWGFAVDLRLDHAATRDAMLDGMRALIADARVDDPVVVYYAGHGGILDVTDATPGRVGYLVPTDHDAHGVFRGITELEWSARLAELTARTRNATVIHDCCHAGRTVRGAHLPGARTRALAPIQVTLDELRRLAGPGYAAAPDPLGNRDAVRLTAASGCGLAWERPGLGGRVQGVFTAALLEEAAALRERAMSWAELGRRTRDRVVRATGRQRPELEGPVRRRVFGLDELEAPVAFQVRPRGRHVVLDAGWAHGVEPGDVFRSTRDPHQIAVIVRVGCLASEVRVERPAGAPPAFEAVAARRSTREPIAVDADDPDTGRAIAAAIHRAPRLRAAGADPATMRVRVERGGLVLLDEHGAIGPPIAAGPEGIAEAVGALARFAAARGLGRLAARFCAPADLAMTVARPGSESLSEASWLPDGAELAAADRVCVHLTNRTRHTLWLHVFSVGARGAVAALGPMSSGIQLEPGATEELGALPGVGSVGFALGRAAPPGTGARPIELIAIATTAPTDLTCLATPDPVGDAPAASGSGARSPVEASRDLNAVAGEHRVLAARRWFLISA